MDKVLIIIPAYNEQDNIAETIISLEKCCPNVDYVVINDASTDNTKDILKKYNAKYISLPINLGIGGGVQTGYLYALENDYDIAIQMDGDGQHLPEYIPKMIYAITQEKADVVIGSRFINKEGFQSSSSRRAGIKILSFIANKVSGCEVKDMTSGYRAVNRKYIKILSEEYAQDYPEPEALVQCSLLGAHILEIPVIMRERTHGNSSITILKSIYYMVKVSFALMLQKISWNTRHRKR